MVEWKVIVADCREAMAAMPADSVDAVVCDPPYDLTNRVPDVWKCAACGRVCGGHDGNPDACPRCGGELRRQRSQGKGFMGKDWDGTGVAFDPDTWRAAYRVMKPGAHLVAFGGTRTHHRLMCAIEDAGFEIRDTLCWLHGQGFPKNLNIGKALDKRRDDLPDVLAATRWISAAVKRSGLTHAAILVHFGFNEGSGQVGHWTAKSMGAQPAVPTWDQWLELKALLGCGDDMDAEVWRLNGRKGKPGEAWFERPVVGLAYRVRGESIVDFAGRSAGEYPLTAPATDLGHEWHGFGTALKPSFEPIVLARKPLIGSVAANVARHGVGGINVDGCRVRTGGRPLRERDHQYRPETVDLPSGSRAVGSTDLGRWPPNTILTHHPDCVPCGTRRVKGDNSSTRGRGGAVYGGGRGYTTDFPETGQHVGYADADGTEETARYACVPECPVRLLDRQSGERGKSVGVWRASPPSGIFGATLQSCPADRDGERIGYGDTGDASRFFPAFAWAPGEVAEATRFLYCAKSSRRERNAGLEGMPERNYGLHDDDAYRQPGERKANHTAPLPAANFHPTVKPVQLMKWLCRLVTPPGGTVLDPFAGSGTTGMAALLEGFAFVGIEQQEEYAAIAERRIAHVARHGERWLEAAGKPTPPAPGHGIYASGKGIRTIARCPEHDAPQNERSSAYVCGCPVRRVNPRDAAPHDAPPAAAPASGRVYDGGKGRRSLARCPEHDAPQPPDTRAGTYRCGCRVVYENPRAISRHHVPPDVTPTLADLPLFAAVGADD